MRLHAEEAAMQYWQGIERHRLTLDCLIDRSCLSLCVPPSQRPGIEVTTNLDDAAVQSQSSG